VCPNLLCVGLELGPLPSQVQDQVSALAQHIEDMGQLQELWLEEFKRIGTLLLMAEKGSSICSKAMSLV